MMAFSPSVRQARSLALAQALEGGTLTFYTAPQPVWGAAITTQTALATHALPDTLTPIDGALTLPFEATTVMTDGTAVWGRITDALGNWVIDGDCGDLSSAALFQINTPELIQGGDLIPLLVQISES